MNTAVFAISPHSLFQIHPYAQTAIAVSGIASGLGIATDAWFLLRYNWIDLKTFIVRCFQPLTMHVAENYLTVPCTRCLRIIFLFCHMFQDARNMHVRVRYRFDGFPRFCRFRSLATGRFGRVFLRGNYHDLAIPCLWDALGHK